MLIWAWSVVFFMCSYGKKNVTKAYFLEKHMEINFSGAVSLGERIVGEFCFHFCVFLDCARITYTFQTQGKDEF